MRRIDLAGVRVGPRLVAGGAYNLFEYMVDVRCSIRDEIIEESVDCV